MNVDPTDVAGCVEKHASIVVRELNLAGVSVNRWGVELQLHSGKRN
jgi:hypothetical protein